MMEMKQTAPNFSVIFSTRDMIQRMESVKVVQMDATYHLCWNGFSLFIVGTSLSTGKFFPSLIALTSNEKTKSWSGILDFIFSEDHVEPNFILPDGAKTLSNAVEILLWLLAHYFQIIY